MALTDSELLRRIAGDGDEAAVAELVRRYIDLVYAAALRQVAGDAHLAEEVAQDVFFDCARKAGTLQNRENIRGWLYTSTHFAASKRQRAERRRKMWENAYAMNESITGNSATNADWSRVRPVLDSAMRELGERDRETVLLRYFARRSVADIGQQLGLTENAAAKAIERALDRLRERIRRRGIYSAAGALAAVLTEQAVTAAPITLASTISTAIAAGAQAGTVGAATFFIMSKTTATVCAAGTLIVASAVLNILQSRERAQLQEEVAAVKQDSLRASRISSNDRHALEVTRQELQAIRDRDLAENHKPSSVTAAAAEPMPPTTPANTAIVGYLGDPVPPPANLDPKYTAEGMSAAFRALCQSKGVNIKKLAVDTTEYPFLLYGLIDRRGFLQQIDGELRESPGSGYAYEGSVSGRTSDGSTFFSLNLIPSDLYPRDQRDAIQRRLMIRLQMLGAIWTDQDR